MEGNKDDVPQVTGHNLHTSVGGLVLDGFLDDQHSLLPDNQATTHRATLAGVYLGQIHLAHKRRVGNQVHNDPSFGVGHIGSLLGFIFG